jgi:hypothetical protein
MRNGIRIQISSGNFYRCSGSVSFLASRIRKSEVQIRILPSSSKNSKKALYFYGLRLLYDFIFEE